MQIIRIRGARAGLHPSATVPKLDLENQGGPRRVTSCCDKSETRIMQIRGDLAELHLLRLAAGRVMRISGEYAQNLIPLWRSWNADQKNQGGPRRVTSLRD